MKDTSRIYQMSSIPGVDPIRHLDPPRMLDLVGEEVRAGTPGIAQHAGWQLQGYRPIVAYRMMTGGDELCGLFTCVGRRSELVPATPDRAGPPVPVKQRMHELIALLLESPIQELAMQRLARALSKTGPVIFKGFTFEGAEADGEWLVRRRPTRLVRRGMTTFPIYPDARTVDVTIEA
jgi:hypothetical protein